MMRVELSEILLRQERILDGSRLEGKKLLGMFDKYGQPKNYDKVITRSVNLRASRIEK